MKKIILLLVIIFTFLFSTTSWGEWSYVGYHRDLSLGGTPLAEATLYMREAVKEMRKVEKVQKVNVICLTDGEANPISFVADRSCLLYTSPSPRD